MCGKACAFPHCAFSAALPRGSALPVIGVLPVLSEIVLV